MMKAVNNQVYHKNNKLVFLTLLLLFCDLCLCSPWDHVVDFDDNYRLLWTSNSQDITFEIHAKTLGYIGLGFSKDGSLMDADLAIGWIDQGHPLLQDRHMKVNDDGEPLPIMDPVQDYSLILGYENSTHTVLRFKRKLDTCDTNNDLAITNDTMRVIFMYSDEKPRNGAVLPGTLPKPLEAFKGSKSLFLTQRSSHNMAKNEEEVLVIELKNEDVELPRDDDTLYWCKVFKMNDFEKKHHIIRYEPAFDSATSVVYLNHITLYECKGTSETLEAFSRTPGASCENPDSPKVFCIAVVANWVKGSEGFTFPQETGYPLDLNQAKYYMMESHYNNPDYRYDYTAYEEKNSVHQQQGEPQMVDNSGLKLFVTSKLRKFDAGILSVGMYPNWKHIIPPKQERVISSGTCISECTKYGFPKKGINIFAVMTRTHMIGKEVSLKHVRNDEELQPIAHDTNVDALYQEYRRLPAPVKAMPGDTLIAECIYDSSSRKSITLGGLTSREEICIIYTLYYPRQKELTMCHSLPSLPTVLHSLGIQSLEVKTNPVLIASPPELAGQSLERRLMTYDWENQFDSFQEATQHGSFIPMCRSANNVPIPGTEKIEVYSPNITKAWKAANKCNRIPNYVTEMEPPHSVDLPANDQSTNGLTNVIPQNKVSRSSSVVTTQTMGLSGTVQITPKNQFVFLFTVTFIRLLAFN